MKICLFLSLALLLGALTTHAQTKKDSLYVFIGERISVEQLNADSVKDYWNNVFKAKYRIVSQVYNRYKKDTIEFLAYDHYGNPAFAEYEHALLFVYDLNDKLVHVQYQYYDVVKTKDNKWASPGNPYRFRDPKVKGIEAKPIHFEKPVIVNIRKVPFPVWNSMGGNPIRTYYSAPYYRVENDTAVALQGAYVDDLLKIEMNGSLKAYHIFP